MDGPWIDWTDAQVLDAARAKGGAIDPAYNDLAAELDRRAANRQASSARKFALASTIFAAIAAGASAVAAWAAWASVIAVPQ